MDFMKMLEEYKKFANLSNEEKAAQTVEQIFAIDKFVNLQICYNISGD